MSTDQLVEDLLLFWRNLRQASHPVRRGDITPEQFWLLRYLHQNGSSSIGTIAEALGVSQSSATTACQRLERAGLALRTRSTHDERVVKVALTPAGEERIQAWRRTTRLELTRLLAPLSLQERNELQRLLRKALVEFDAPPEQPLKPRA